MSHKTFAQVSVLILILVALLAIPLSARAGGVCDSTYVVQWGDTLDTIAWRFGVTVYDLYAANPGLSGYLYVGQVLAIPYSDYCSPANYTVAYVIQFGDTFGGIAARYGVSVYDLWTANQHIADINYLYVGQVIYVPASAGQMVYAPPLSGQITYAPAPAGQVTYMPASAGEIYASTTTGQVVYIPPAAGQVVYPLPSTGQVYVPSSTWYAISPTPTEEAVPLSYGTVPYGTPKGKIKLVNKANGDVYVSLQGATYNIIEEYPVSDAMLVKLPVGQYDYVAWVGGQQFTGYFSLNAEWDRTMTFYSNKVVVE